LNSAVEITEKPWVTGATCWLYKRIGCKRNGQN